MSGFNHIRIDGPKNTGHGKGIIRVEPSGTYTDSVWVTFVNDREEVVLLMDDATFAAFVSAFNEKRTWQREKFGGKRVEGRALTVDERFDAVYNRIDDADERIASLMLRIDALEQAERKRNMPSLDSIERFWDDGGYISTIKVLRERTGCGLKEAKDKVDGWWPLFTAKRSWDVGEHMRFKNVAYVRVNPNPDMPAPHCFIGDASSEQDAEVHVNGSFADCGWRRWHG